MPYTDSLAHFYDMSTPVALPDLGIPGGNPGVGANIVGNPEGMPGGRCAEFNGTTSNYNLDDVTELNAVSAFTIAFWMNQDVLDVLDYIFQKHDDATHTILVFTGAVGDMNVWLRDGVGSKGVFDYSAVVGAGQWHHIAIVFDGAGSADADRLKIYVDASPMSLTFSLTTPTATADLTGRDAVIGDTSDAFDGKIDSFAIFSRALTNLQVTDHMIATRQGRL